MTSRPPIIAITTSGRSEEPLEAKYYDENYVSPAPYADAVRRAGGVPVLIPPGEDRIDAWMSLADGFVIAGGTDLDPAHYDGNLAHEKLLKAAPDRDRCELALTEAILGDAAKPALFICRGLQLLNVVCGGTLHEHLPDVIDRDIHRSDDGGWTMQGVNVQSQSKLAAIMQTDHVETCSGHHQAVAKVGQGLNVSALADDGVVEGLEIAARPYLIAVQWHPEITAASDRTQQNLFDSLVAASRTA